MSKKKSPEEKRKKLMNKGMKYLTALKHAEFRCPLCGGIASISHINDVLKAECHACGTWARK